MIFLLIVAANTLDDHTEEIINADANTAEILFKCIFPPKKEYISKLKSLWFKIITYK